MELYNQHMNIEESVISTTFSLDKETLDVVHDLKKLQVKKFSLRIHSDKDILGGFNLKIETK